MGWFFRNSTSTTYDGVKAKFLYNSTYNNNPKQLAFQRIFKLDDMYDTKLDLESEEPISIIRDSDNSSWDLVRHRSSKVCLKPG
jgi:hypothetical protein